MLRRLRKGQSTAEYAIVIGLVIAAAVAMQVYVKRGLQGKIRDAVDFTQKAGAVTIGNDQYEPYYLTQNLQSTRTASQTENTAIGGGVTRTTDQDVSTRTGTVTTERAK